MSDKPATTTTRPPDMPKPVVSPARDWLVIKMEDASEKKGMLYVPDTAKEAPHIGAVRAVGPGVFSNDTLLYERMVTKVGDRVVFAKYAGAEIEWEGETLVLVRESDIIGYIK